MNPETGEVVMLGNKSSMVEMFEKALEIVTVEEAAKRGCTVPIPPPELEAVVKMNRKQRREWAKKQGRKR